MEIIIWFLSILIFSWCYSSLFMGIFNIKLAPTMKISVLLYLIIIAVLYTLAYFLLNNYLKDIIICSILAAILSFFASGKAK